MTALRTPSRRLAFANLAVAVVLGAATACGSSDTDDAGTDDVASLDDDAPDAPDATTEGTTAPEDIEDAMLAFTECMRDHGIDMPDPQVRGDGGEMAITLEGDMDTDAFEEAQEACEPLMENARGNIEIDPEEQAEMQAEMLEFAACMREQGIDMPDPVFTDDGRVMQAGPPLDGEGTEFGGAEFEAAADACGRGGDFAVSASPLGEVDDGGDD